VTKIWAWETGLQDPKDALSSQSCNNLGFSHHLSPLQGLVEVANLPG
jgi:hypothetical protein